MNRETDREILKQRNAIRFIEAAQELIDTIGLKDISVRKIAEKAGFHNSTIYLYFEDLDQLILLASLKHFNDYSKALALESQKQSSPIEAFRSIWAAFAQAVFAKPEIFYNFFFGKHSDNLTQIFEQYYRLFPSEKGEFSREIQDMYFGKNISDRCYRILTPLLDEDTRLTSENISIVNEIIVSYLKYLLEEQCQNKDAGADARISKLLTAISYLIGI